MTQPQEIAQALVNKMQVLSEGNMTKERYAQLLEVFKEFIQASDHLSEAASRDNSITGSFR